MAIDIHSQQGLFGSKHKIFRLYNSYSVNGTSCSSCTLSPLDLFPSHPFPTITIGDFNLHHPLPNPLRELSSQDISVSAPYFDRATDLGFSLLNVPSIFSRFPFDSSNHPLSTWFDQHLSTVSTLLLNHTPRKRHAFSQSHGGQTNLVHSTMLSTQPPAGAESSLLPPTSATRKTSRTSTFTLSSKQRPPTGNNLWQR